jgi:glycosyltransferase involved in cell wall biosynthesis
VLFLGYNFGLPVIAADVGSLRDDVVEGETGFVCPARDPRALAFAIVQYFSSELYRELAVRRSRIRAFAHERYSWTKVAEKTIAAYRVIH